MHKTPTDTVKNIVYATAKALASPCGPEAFGKALALKLANWSPYISKATVDVVQKSWSRVALDASAGASSSSTPAPRNPTDAFFSAASSGIPSAPLPKKEHSHGFELIPETRVARVVAHKGGSAAVVKMGGIRDLSVLKTTQARAGPLRGSEFSFRQRAGSLDLRAAA